MQENHQTDNQHASPDQPGKREFGKTISFFKPASAVTIQYTKTQSNKPYNTLSIEICTSENFEANWSDKQIRQVSKAELHDFCACLLGYKPSLEGKFHGPNKNRSYQMVRSREGLNITITGKGESMRYSNLSSSDVFKLTKFALERLVSNYEESFTVRDAMNMMQTAYLPRFTN